MALAQLAPGPFVLPDWGLRLGLPGPRATHTVTHTSGTMAVLYWIPPLHTLAHVVCRAQMVPTSPGQELKWRGRGAGSEGEKKEVVSAQPESNQ